MELPMSESTIRARASALADSFVTRPLGRVHITTRGIQIALGSIWLLDGLLQFQSYMYSKAFITQVLEPNASRQPGVIGGPITTLAHFYGHDLLLFNTLAAEIQCAIGLGLILSKRTVRPALLISFCWAFIVWWFGEGFGMILSGAPVSPLMGAPGAVLVYGLIGALVWPRDSAGESTTVNVGLFGRRGGRVVWSVLWLDAAVLWFLNVDRSRTAIHDQIAGMASTSPHWLATILMSVANSTQGHGVIIATLLGVGSILIALGVWTAARPGVLAVGALLSLAYWVFGQSIGGPFWIGNATDVNTGPLLVLLALMLVTQPRTAREPARATGTASAGPPDQAVATA
jgi:hypothetical protein